MKRRRAKPTPKRLAQFLDELSRNGNVTISAELCNLERTRLYELRQQDPTFAVAWQDALDMAAEHLEAEARRRAVEGVLQKKFTTKGDPVIDPETGEQYLERAYSDTLLIFLLKGANPEKYRERSSTELTGPGGGPLQTSVQIYLPANNRDEEMGE